jgi:sulfite reductase (NADPH) flavoprotein alpha-component
MLTPSKLKAVEELVAGYTEQELVWLHGYLAGLLARTNATTTPSASTPQKITITYGTETGNSKKLASEFAARAKKIGIAAKLVGLDQYRVNDLQKEEYFLTIVSTQGEGDPPAAAQKFYEYIHGESFELKGLNYGVLALGDTSYPLFCKAGEDVDQQLNRLGGRRIVPLQKCDTDYATDAEEWFARVLEQLSSTTPAPSVKEPAARPASGKKIHRGTIRSLINLNDRGSNKETYHIEIEAEGVDYQPGDALGIVPHNTTEAVEEILRLCNAEGERSFQFRNDRLPLANLLHQKLHIAYLPERVVARYAALVQQDIPATRMNLSDLLRIYPLEQETQLEHLIDLLEPMAPRLYSIASSPEAHNGEIHLTVARDLFLRNQEWKQGLCSGYLSTLEEGSEIDFYIHRNERFRLPADNKDVIMIGPGTGVAPFRSFVAQRDATGATGRSWLFFGDQHFVTDFLYQSEWQSWLELGALTRIDLAFSRDQQEKIYVQHQMLRHGADIYKWLENGAHLYLCGNKDPMSLDVENTLAEIVSVHGKRSPPEALRFIETLKEEDRYLKDVY